MRDKENKKAWYYFFVTQATMIYSLGTYINEAIDDFTIFYEHYNFLQKLFMLLGVFVLIFLWRDYGNYKKNKMSLSLFSDSCFFASIYAFILVALIEYPPSFIIVIIVSKLDEFTSIYIEEKDAEEAERVS